MFAFLKGEYEEGGYLCYFVIGHSYAHRLWGGGGDSTPANVGVGGSTGTGSSPSVTAIALSPTSASQHWGKTIQLQAVVTDFAGAVVSGQGITYVSSDTNVSAVNAVGVASLLNPGTTTVTAVLGSVTSNVGTITVKGFVSTSIAVAGEDNCVLDDTKTEIICWGQGYPMYPNLPLQSNYPSPLKLNMGQIPSGTAMKQVAPGFMHSCTLTTAGAAYCWAGAARNSASEIAAMGTNSRMPIGEPALVQRGEIPPGVTLLKLSQGFFSTCALGDDGNVYCWGASSYLPRPVTSFPLGTNFYNAPVKIAGSAKFVDYAKGTNRDCALSDIGQLYCGRNSSGSSATALTLVSNPASEVPANVKLIKLKSEKGDGDFMMALGDDGWVYSFGSGFGRRFGNGSNVFVSDENRLTRIAQGNIPNGVKIRDFSPGGISSSSCVVGDNGKAYCWGRGYFGSLGDGNLAEHDVLSPQLVLQGQVPANVTLASIGCGTFHCAAIGSDRKTYAWGFKENAAIGGTESVAVPTLINKVGN